MKQIEIFDPALCFPTGVCGPSVDSKLVQAAADIEALKKICLLQMVLTSCPPHL